MAGMKLSDLDFLRLLPAFMRDDEAVIALSKAMNSLMGEPSKRLSTIRTWDKIDELNEAECDELAWELDIDWYDSEDMTLEEKRETIKIAQQIKRKRGTKWAVERLISVYFGEGYVAEWYEMGTAPYTFMVLTTNTHVMVKNFDKFVKAIKIAKNERSHLAGIFYYWPQGSDGVEYSLKSSLHRYDFDACGTKDRVATLGFVLKTSVETEPEATVHKYSYPSGLELTGAALVGTAIVGYDTVSGAGSSLGSLKCGTWPRTITTGTALKASTGAAPSETCIIYGGFPECGADGYKAKTGVAVVGTAVVGRAVVTTA